jgi:hypothetical protein
MWLGYVVRILGRIPRLHDPGCHIGRTSDEFKGYLPGFDRMIAAYKELKMEIPRAGCLMEQLAVEVESVSQTA